MITLPMHDEMRLSAISTVAAASGDMACGLEGEGERSEQVEGRMRRTSTVVPFHTHLVFVTLQDGVDLHKVQ